MQIECNQCRSCGEVGPPEYCHPGLLTCPQCGAPITVRPLHLPEGDYLIECAGFGRDGHGWAILRPLYRPGQAVAGAPPGHPEPWTGCRVRVGEEERVIGPVRRSCSLIF